MTERQAIAACALINVHVNVFFVFLLKYHVNDCLQTLTLYLDDVLHF